MSKLYVFGIGGTGSRVIRSLTMLLAAGVECKFNTIVPIIIDRDLANEDLSRTKLLIENYVEVNKIADTKGQNRFFKTEIELLNNELCLKLVDNTQNFESFIGRSTMSSENRALVDMLFSKETLKLDMTAGFQGNPNIGSTVLNQLEDTAIFKDFANNFQSGDRIFIISSIFGGTGASGFPLLRKVLHTPNVKDSSGTPLNNWGLINNAPIAATTVLPYFNVKSATDDSLVNSSTFIDKCKAALSYYKTEDKKLDTLYYVADKQISVYDHNKGGSSQKNNAHFTELAAALAVLDFADTAKDAQNIHRNPQGEIIETTYKEFGLKSNSPQLNFDHLADRTKTILVNPLTRFMLFRNYMQYTFDTQHGHQPYAKKRFEDNFRNKNVIQKLESVQAEFYRWIEEMGDQAHRFVPFNLSDTGALNFVSGNIQTVTKSNDFRYTNWARVDNTLNRQIGKIVNSLPEESQFLELFFRMSESLINYK